MRVRPAAVAGSFYPGNEDVLREMVDAMLRAARRRPPVPKAVIVPHAGYVYSGSTAAEGYACLAPIADSIEHVVLVGPCHYVGVRGVALPDADALATPLGDVPVWREGADVALAQPGVVVSAAVHEREHSLEVQLPFIQRLLPAADVLPLAVGWAAPEQVGAVLDAVWGGAETVVVVSSDLSHYLPYAQAQDVDAQTIADILALVGPIDSDRACGAGGVNGLLVAARGHSLTPRLISACNSGDTAGDKRRVVGYASVAFDETRDGDVAP